MGFDFWNDFLQPAGAAVASFVPIAQTDWAREQIQETFGRFNETRTDIPAWARGALEGVGPAQSKAEAVLILGLSAIPGGRAATAGTRAAATGARAAASAGGGARVGILTSLLRGGGRGAARTVAPLLRPAVRTAAPVLRPAASRAVRNIAITGTVGAGIALFGDKVGQGAADLAGGLGDAFGGFFGNTLAGIGGGFGRGLEGAGQGFAGFAKSAAPWVLGLGAAAVLAYVVVQRQPAKGARARAA